MIGRVGQRVKNGTIILKTLFSKAWKKQNLQECNHFMPIMVDLSLVFEI